MARVIILPVMEMCRATAAFVLLAVFASTLSAQFNSQGQWEHGLDLPNTSWNVTKFKKDELKILVERWQLIEDESKRTKNTFAGTYSLPNNHAAFLKWAPEGGFAYIQTYEGLDVVDFSYGTVISAGQDIQLLPQRDLSSTFFASRLRPTTRTWIPARWENRTYLIEANRISDFGLYAAGLGRYNEYTGPCCDAAAFFVRLGEVGLTDDKAWQKPWLPAKYARLIRWPVETTITFVGKRRVVNDYGLEGADYSTGFPKASLTTVQIDAGANKSVRPGLLFRLREAPYGQYLKITRVKRRSSIGVLIRELDKQGRETYYDSTHNLRAYAPVDVGQRVTTSPLFY
jgi:hypothetical protein